MTGGAGTGRLTLDDFRHEALVETVSTNTECFERARKGALSGLWVTAARQTGGRGRRGRPWTSEPGNLYASLLLIDPAPVERLGSLPLAAAVAVQAAIASVMPLASPPVLIKWPNDILIERKKICGILVESEMLADGRQAIVIGCGINVAVAPEGGLYPIGKLSDYGCTVAPAELFAHLYREMADTLRLWDSANGIGEIMARWRKVAGGIGETITVNLPTQSISGRFAGIDDTGLLKLVNDDGGVRLIAAGDVFFE
ncbi:biotin--[acetyl-CoA-carboxylase] ligase [Mycoplana dimorpha]|uniref:biotin--[biotin carboxyl-carrier protein] ligase n=1 Tax=Mycoplana dimorpha TaxID=28320 RepID=A0A2T5ATX8_MYCDI|nr:biotin--[acetyl-CoA-carboxylase] ligase [Mycoplana dimorpha]PTM90170.1 BirA family biotin operon repressor/biotin-[acetyl-CoA-carboxylase] ligase [Mycoplana dimorpha]